jgi:hypothetical protein
LPERLVKKIARKFNGRHDRSRSPPEALIVDEAAHHMADVAQQRVNGTRALNQAGWALTRLSCRIV